MCLKHEPMTAWHEYVESIDPHIFFGAYLWIFPDMNPFYECID